jgi:hypothetical protein
LNAAERVEPSLFFSGRDRQTDEARQNASVVIDWVFAIRNRRLVRFVYEGLERIVIPAAYGLNRNSGNRLLRAYQVGGRDSKRSLPTWSLFRVDHVVEGQVLGELFEEIPPGYRSGDRSMDTIYAQL